MKRFCLIFMFILTSLFLFSCQMGGLTGGDGDGSAGNESVDNLDTQEEIMDNLNNNYYFVIDVIAEYDTEEDGKGTDKETFTYATNGTYEFFVSSDENERVLLKHEDGVTTAYQYNEETGKYDSSTSTTLNLGANAMSYLLTYTGQISYSSKRNVTFLNRACVEYTQKDSFSFFGVTASYEHTIVIDNETGACLKMSYSAKGGTLEESGSGSATFEVKTFETGDKVTEIINEEVKKISEDANQTDWLELNGFSAINLKAYQIIAMTSDEDEFSASLNITGEDASQQFDNLLVAFFRLGFNAYYDAENDDYKTLTNLKDENIYEENNFESGSYISFDAYKLDSGNPTYCLQINASVVSGQYTVSIEISKIVE